MVIRLGTAEEMRALWQEPSSTSDFFASQIQSENAEFWTIADGQRLIGELYLFKKLGDPEFADGARRAYLCAFRIAKEQRGKGLGTSLMTRVFQRLRELSFAEASIGVEENEAENMRLYQRLGFTDTLKYCSVDPCAVDASFRPLACNQFLLLRKHL